MSKDQYQISTACSLEWYPPEGVPTSAKLSLYDQSSGVIIDDEDATIDAASASVTTGLRRSRELVADSTTGLQAGRRYWLADASGDGSEVEIVGISGTTITLLDQLRHTVSGGSLSGLRVSYDIDATDITSTSRRCRAVWSYTAAGVARSYTEMVDFVRWPFAIEITEREIAQVASAFGETDSKTGQALRLRAQAERDIIAWLRGHQIIPDLVRDRRLLESAAVYRVLYLRHIRDAQLSEAFERLYKAALADFDSSHSWYDRDDDLVIDADSDGDLDIDETSGELAGPPRRYVRI